VTFAIDKTIIAIGDTFKVTLHASDPTLSGGSLNLGDGTIILFTHLNNILDTSITHVYSQTRTYLITAMFSDGYASTDTSVSVVANHFYFALSFEIGMWWQFSYNFSYISPPSMITEYQWGIHEWKILSYTVDNQDTTYLLQQTKKDTQDYNGTTYLKNDTTEFTFVVSDSTIQINWPMYSSPNSFTIPNHRYVTQYPVFIYPAYLGGGVSCGSSYNDQAGPIGYDYNFQTTQSISGHEGLSLINFIKP